MRATLREGKKLQFKKDVRSENSETCAFPLTELYSVRALFGLLIAVAAVVKPPQDPFDPLYVPIVFWGPFEQIANNNRNICIALCLIIIFRCGARSPSAGILGLIIFLHTLILAKNIISGAPDAILIFVALLIVAVTCSSFAGQAIKANATREVKLIYFLITPLIIASISFVACNCIQFVMGREATMVVGGRFSGLTSNPQAFTMCLTIIVPTMLYVYHAIERWWWISLVILPVILYFALLTGSRLAAIEVGVAIVLFYRKRLGRLVAAALPLTAVAMILASNLSIDVDVANSRISSTENTREFVWQTQMEEVVSYPLFGRPLEEGARLGFGENSYLAAGSGVGIIGLLTALALAGQLVGLSRRLLNAENNRVWRPELSLCFSIIGSVLVGSFAEAVLFGIFTMTWLALIQVALLSQALVRRIPRMTEIR